MTRLLAAGLREQDYTGFLNPGNDMTLYNEARQPNSAMRGDVALQHVVNVKRRRIDGSRLLDRGTSTHGTTDTMKSSIHNHQRCSRLSNPLAVVEHAGFNVHPIS